MPQTQNFQRALQRFLARAELALEDQLGQSSVTLLDHAFAAKRYIKIITVPYGSIFAFVDKQTGAIHAPEDDSHASPIPRGSIFDQLPELAVDALGAVRRRPQ